MTRANAYTENLGTDWIATDHQGTPIGRASDETAIRAAVPDAAAYLNAKTLMLDGQSLPQAGAGPVNDALARVAAQSAGNNGTSPTADRTPEAEPTVKAKKPSPVAVKPRGKKSK